MLWKQCNSTFLLRLTDCYVTTLTIPHKIELPMVKLNHDMIKALPDWKAADAPQIPPNTDTGAMVVTAENVDQFRHE